MKKRLWSRLAAAAVLAIVPSLASAQAWPSKPVKIVVPFNAGGATDIVARLLAQKLSELLSAQIEVESEVGRGSTFTVRFPRLGPHPSFP